MNVTGADVGAEITSRVVETFTYIGMNRISSTLHIRFPSKPKFATRTAAFILSDGERIVFVCKLLRLSAFRFVRLLFAHVTSLESDLEYIPGILQLLLRNTMVYFQNVSSFYFQNSYCHARV